MATTLETISSALNQIDSKKQNLKIAFENLQSKSSSLPLSWLQLDSHFTSLQQSLTHRFNILQSLQQSQSKTLIPNPNDENSKNANKLKVLCEKMDGIGLKNYVSDNFNDKFRVEVELREAIRFSPDAGMMILQSLEEGFNERFKHKGMREMGRGCLMLLRVLSVSGVNVSGKARERALKVAIGWKVRLMGDCGNISGALGFLYLVYAFGIVNEFSVDELVEFGVAAAINDEFMQLCRKIALTDKIPDIIQKLVDRGKRVLAVKYIFEFNLAHEIPPVPILKACVDESKKLTERLSQEGKSRMEITDREMRALKSVIEIIEIHKLESEYPQASLEQRIEQLKGPDANIKHRTVASILNQHTLERRQRKRRMKKQQQENGIKIPRTSTSVGLAAVLKNDTNNDNSTIRQYQQPLVNPSEIVQKLVERGKHVLAVKYVFEFNLADKIPPVPILKAAVDESRKLARRLSEEGKRRMEITDRELRVLKTVIEIIEIHKLESEYPRDSLEQRIEQLKGQDPNMKDRTPASIVNQHTLQRRQQKRRMKKQQQQNGIKIPRTSTSVGPAAVPKNDTNNDNSTMQQYQQPLVNPSGLFPEHPNPYKIPRATSSGMVAPIPTISSYTGPSAGPYGFAGIPMGLGGNPSLGGSHLSTPEPCVPSAYYGSNNFTYGVINPQHFQAPYYPQ